MSISVYSIKIIIFFDRGLYMSQEEVEINLNKYLELIDKKQSEMINKIDDMKKIDVYVVDDNYYSHKLLTIVNYSTHVKLVEYFESAISEASVERILHDVKPSTVLKILLPKLFR